MRPHILSESTGDGILRAYIESSPAFIREHHKRRGQDHKRGQRDAPMERWQLNVVRSVYLTERDGAEADLRQLQTPPR